MDLSPERPLNSLNNSASKINTPAKLLMVGEPILVKTDQSESTGSSKELSGATNVYTLKIVVIVRKVWCSILHC